MPIIKLQWIIGIIVGTVLTMFVQRMPRNVTSVEVNTSSVPSSNGGINAKDTMAVCSTKQRLGTIEQYCKEHNVAADFMYKFRRRQKLLELQQQRRQGRADSSSSAANRQQASDWLDELPDEEILRISSQLLMDPFNKVIVCLHAKAGSTTWKAILGNNSMASPSTLLAISLSMHVYLLEASDLQTMVVTSMTSNIDLETGIKLQLCGIHLTGTAKFEIFLMPIVYNNVNSWHFASRLISSFIDKLNVNSSRPGLKRFSDEIMYRYHGSRENHTHVTFKDFIQLILDGYQNDHWNGPYEDKCHTCLLCYDYIVKLESQTQDARYIIDHKLRGRGLDTHFNQRRPQNSLLTRHGRDLAPYFHTLSQQQYHDLQKKYASDFHMFGYHMDDRTFVAKCSDQAANGTCC